MNTDIQHDRHKQARANEDRLKAWIDLTPVSDIPVNQFGESSRMQICNTLNISRSTVRSNPRIRDLFAELDERIKKNNVSRSNAKRKLTRRARELKYVSGLQERVDEAELRCARFQYLEDNGHLLRE
ncbi:hypothetical protein [Paraburkholderia bryophila]|uniref:Uncharacterized protein n=1 Tax=Paraburkholderia bryophila TaxID=420952 RepID=A0A7Y9WDJ6_9BURK|nr:hypothetical protein [Paraburkholderia bryophila]NYH18879.1 hypothetical protein [Paraburkholderia bryophila]